MSNRLKGLSNSGLKHGKLSHAIKDNCVLRGNVCGMANPVVLFNSFYGYNHLLDI